MLLIAAENQVIKASLKINKTGTRVRFRVGVGLVNIDGGADLGTLSVVDVQRAVITMIEIRQLP